MFFSSVPLFPGRCIGATILISRSLRSWPLRCLFPSHCGVGGYDAYFQVAAGLAVTTLIPRSATEIGATYFQVATRGLAVTLFPDPPQRLERHLFPGRCGVGGYNAYSQVRNRTDWSDTYFQVAVGLAVTPRIPRSVSKQRLERLISRL